MQAEAAHPSGMNGIIVELVIVAIREITRHPLERTCCADWRRMTLFRQTTLRISQHVLSTFDTALQDLPVQRHTETLFERP
jgi:hypothetical protein